jgi:hypothetical protein
MWISVVWAGRSGGSHGGAVAVSAVHPMMRSGSDSEGGERRGDHRVLLLGWPKVGRTHGAAPFYVDKPAGHE